MTIFGAANESEIRVDANYVKQAVFFFFFTISIFVRPRNCWNELQKFYSSNFLHKRLFVDHWLTLVLPMCRAYLLLNRH